MNTSPYEYIDSKLKKISDFNNCNHIIGAIHMGQLAYGSIAFGSIDVVQLKLVHLTMVQSTPNHVVSCLTPAQTEHPSFLSTT